MSSIESRIVTMKFDNKEFEKNAQTSFATLAKLKNVLDLGATGKIGSSLGNIGKSLNLGEANAQVGGLSAKFLALGTIGVTALANITNQALTLGKNLAASVSGINAVRDGFSDYELKVGATQTIMSGTGENIATVTKYLKELDIYADKTIYSLSDMTSNIGKFTNAGVKLPVAVEAMKGIANVAALSGANSEEAARAMYNLGQAIGNGTVKLMDWKSVELANMGTKEFKEQLIDAAVAAGTLTKASDGTIKSLKGNEVNFKTFSSTLADGWLTSKALTDTLSAYADETTDIGEKAYAAAQDVKTFSMMMETLKAAAGTGWTDTFEIVLGTLPEATRLFTAMTNAIGGVLGRQADARNKVLAEWKALGGRTDLIQAFKNIFKAIGAVLKPIHEAFRDIFPAATGKQLADLTEAFRRFTEKLIISDETAENIGDTFRGIFSVIKIFVVIIGAAIKYVAQFFGILVSGTGNADGFGAALLSITGAIGKVVTAIHDWLMEGAKLEKFFAAIIKARNAVLAPLVAVISNIVQAFVALVTGDVSGFFDHLGSAGEKVKQVLSLIGQEIKGLVGGAGELGATIGSFMANIGGNVVAGAVIAWQKLVDVVNAVKNAFSFGGGGGGGGFDASPIEKQIEKLGFAANAFDRIGGIFKAVWGVLTDVFGGAASNLGPILENIAEAVKLLGDAFNKMLSGMDFTDLIALIQAGVFTKLAFSVSKLFDTMDEVTGLKGDFKDVLNGVTGSLKTMQSSLRVGMIKDIAIAIGILAAALIGLSLVPKEKMGGALKALGAVILMMSAMILVFSKFTFPAGLLLIGPAMISISIALTALAGALRLYEGVDWESMKKAGAALGAMTLALVALGLAGPAVLAGGLALLAAAPGLMIMALVLKSFEYIEWESIGKLAVILTALSLALAGLGAIGPAVLAGAASLFIMGPALVIIAGALKLLEKIKWNAIGRLAVLLTTLALGVTAMIAAMPGAIALNAVAIALRLLIGPLKMLSDMSFWDIVRPIVALSLALTFMGVTAGLVSPALLILGVALGLIGIGLLAAGAGMFLFATGLAIVGAAGATAFAVLMTGITAFLLILPQWIMQFGQTLKAIATVIQTSGPAIIEAFATLLVALIDAVIPLVPKFRALMVVLINNGLQAVRQTFPNVVRTGFAMLLALMKGLDDNIEEITNRAVSIITKFINTLGLPKNVEKLVTAGVKLIKNVGKGIAKQISTTADEAYEKAKEIGLDIVAGIVKGLNPASIMSKIGSIGTGMLGKLADVTGVKSPSVKFAAIGAFHMLGLALGIRRNADGVYSEVETIGKTALSTMQIAMANLSAGMDTNLDLQPTVTPVLDLSLMATEASRMTGLLTVPTVMADLSLSRANNISTEVQDAREDQDTAAPEEPKETKIELTQINNSPRSLDEIEIYRQTNNQFALVKEALSTT